MVERGYPLDHDVHNGTAKTKKTVELTKRIDENFVDYDDQPVKLELTKNQRKTI